MKIVTTPKLTFRISFFLPIVHRHTLLSQAWRLRLAYGFGRAHVEPEYCLDPKLDAWKRLSKGSLGQQLAAFLPPCPSQWQIQGQTSFAVRGG